MNGELLRAAEEAGFEVFLTTDKKDAVNAAKPASYTLVEIPGE